METLVVNLFGVPGSGKSTGAAYIFSKLKMQGINAELVTEYAKDKVWEENNEVFRNQAYLFGKQSYRLSRLDGKVDVIVTDSPLPLSIFYNEDSRLNEAFNQSVMDVFNSYRNINFLLRRTKPYNPAGRRQTEEESDNLGQPIIDLLNIRHIRYEEENGDLNGYETIVQKIVDIISPKSNKATITPGQTLKYYETMCKYTICNKCIFKNYALEKGIYDPCNLVFKYPDKCVELVQEWAIGNGYLTESLEETGKYEDE